MGISTYQVNNVLKVYANQLQRGRLSNISKTENTRSPDTVDISASAKKKAIADKEASGNIEKTTQNGSNDDIEKNISQRLEYEDRKKLFLSKHDVIDKTVFDKILQNLNHIVKGDDKNGG